MLQSSERQQQDGIHLDKHTTHVLVTWAPTYTTSSRGGKILPLKKLLSSPSTSQFGFRVANSALSDSCCPRRFTECESWRGDQQAFGHRHPGLEKLTLDRGHHMNSGRKGLTGPRVSSPSPGCFRFFQINFLLPITTSHRVLGAALGQGGPPQFGARARSFSGTAPHNI